MAYNDEPVEKAYAQKMSLDAEKNFLDTDKTFFSRRKIIFFPW